MRLSSQQKRILQALRCGCHLKVHRTLDGAKVYQLHSATAAGNNVTETIPSRLIEALERHGFLQSNLKFPAASLLLTEQGIQAVAAPTHLHPVGPRRY